VLTVTKQRSAVARRAVEGCGSPRHPRFAFLCFSLSTFGLYDGVYLIKVAANQRLFLGLRPAFDLSFYEKRIMFSWKLG